MSPTSKRSSTTKKKAPKTATADAAKTAAFLKGVFSELAVGHADVGLRLQPQDAELFKAFQGNLLSLISHELRTPLTAILNSLSLLSENETGAAIGMPRGEVLEMAYRNAQRLNQTLSSLLDLAALESGTFHIKLREVELQRLARGVTLVQDGVARRRGLSLEFRNHVDVEVPTLADPHKMGRALSLILEVAMSRAAEGSQIEVDARRTQLSVSFTLKAGGRKEWDRLWTQSVVGREGRSSPALSVFAGALQMEEMFLSRKEEGLGSELLLVHEILRMHQGRLQQRIEGDRVFLELQLADLNSLESLRAVLSARSEQIATGIGSVALALLKTPSGLTVEKFRNEVKSKLFRTTDAVYPLPSEDQIALVMDDCSPLDATRLVTRIQTSLGKTIAHGIAVFPQEAGDSDLLIRIASERLKAFEPGTR